MRFPLRPFDHLPSYDFMRHRAFWIWSSIVLVVCALAFTGWRGLNYGIDFTGGKLIQVQVSAGTPIAAVRETMAKAGFGNATIQEFGSGHEFLIRLAAQESAMTGVQIDQQVLSALQAAGYQPEVRRVEFVGPQVGEELRWKGLLAIGFSVVAILIYIWFRFELRYGLGAIFSLLHDVILTVGVMAVLQTEMTLTVLAAILTLIGYSLNDTIVIFDRIRENRARYPNQPLPEILNLSVNQTMARTIMTVSTTLLVLFALFFFGGEVIHDFSMVLIVGIFLGTYSSVFVASPVLLWFEEYYQKLQRQQSEQKGA